MAASTIISVLAAIPWKDVVQNAPKVAESAIKLWDSVSNRNRKTATMIAAAPSKALSTDDMLKAEVDVLAESVRTLQEQMQASSLLIKDLAEQNTRLVSRVELSRVKHLRLVIAIGIAVAILLGMFVLHVAQH